MTQQDPWDIPAPSRGAPQPLIPREAAPQTGDQAEHQRLSNEALRQQIEQDNQRLDPATVDMIAHQYILAGPSALQNVAGRGRAGQANRDAILNRASQIAGVRSGENVQVGFARYRNGSHAIQNLENQMGTISTNEQNASGAAEQLLTAIRQVYPANSTRPGNIARGIYRDIFNDPAMATFDTARNTFLTEYAKVVAGSPSGSGVLSDSARHEQQENLSRATSPEAAQAAIDQMRRDMTIRLNAFQTNIQRGYTNLENGIPVAFHPNGDLVDEHGRVVPLSRDRAAVPASAPGTGGSQPPAPGTPPNTPPSPDPNFAQNLASAEPGSYARFQALEQYHNAPFLQRGQIGFGDTPEAEWRDSFGLTEAQGRDLEAEYQAQLPHWTQARQVAEQTSAANGGDPGFGQRGRQGFTQGLNDELAGLGYSMGNAAASPFAGHLDPVGSYQMGRDAERIRNSQAQDATGGLGTAVEVGSSIIGSAPLFGVAAPAEGVGLGGRMIAGARAGAPFGAASGWAHGEGLEGSTIGAAEGGAMGGTIGAAAPVLGSLARGGGRFARGAYRLARGENPELAPRTVAQAFTDDANTAAGVGTQMAEAHANGVPMMAADTGDNARGLFAATARATGGAKSLTRTALRQRQEGLGDRVSAAIERDLGPASNPHQVADDLMAQARTAAAPLYDEAYSRPGADTFSRRIAGMLNRPSIQGALQRANRIAAEEGRDPATSGFDVNSSGEVTVSRTPSWQTLDYVKRGIDDVLNAQPRNPATGQIIMDEGTRAIDQTRRAFLGAIDEANPSYAAARAAYAGPAAGREALDLGRRSLSLTADDVSARINRMTDFEKDMYRLGHRRAMVEQVNNTADNGDMVNALIGRGRKREVLARLYGDNENFPRFVSTLQAEQAGHQTFREAMLGSQTAPNIQNDAALPGAITAGMTDLATSGGLPIASGIRQAVKLGATRVGRNSQEQISALLGENDPARISELARVLQERAARAAAAQAAAGQRSGAYGVIGGSLAGRSIQDAYGQ